MRSAWVALGLTALTSSYAVASPLTRRNGSIGPSLEHWPKDAADALDSMIAQNANSGRYAVFDMDNTSYENDLAESLLPYLEAKGVLSRGHLDPSLKILPFKDTHSSKESLYSYYMRICEEIDDVICYAFAAQIFSGVPLRKLKKHVDSLMALNGSIPVQYYKEGVLTNTTVTPPRIFRGQVELFQKLAANGIEVYIVSAASEELVRMVASDPQYGYNVKPENVIGVSLLMKDKHGSLTTSRKQIKDGTYNWENNMDMVMTPTLWTPATWKEGKWAAILTYIDPWVRPILVGGDTPASDGPMQFQGVDVGRGGIHLWIDRKPDYREQIDEMMRTNAESQEKEGLPVTADKNWVIVHPQDIL